MKARLFLLLPVLIVLLAACSIPTPENNGTLTPASPPGIVPTPSCLDAQSFGRLLGNLPGELSIQSLTPQFSWYYNVADFWNNESADPWAEVCVPDSYELYFSTGPDFTDEFSVLFTNPVAPFGDSNNYLVNWVITSALEPMKVYHWIPVGHYGTIDIGTGKIASLHDASKWPPDSYQWNLGAFRTGPECASGNIDIPVLISPAAGATITSQQPKIIWEPTSCMPLVFQLEIYKFSDQSLWFAAQTQVPWFQQYTTTVGSAFPQLADCTRYSWRARGGIDLNGTREWGEWSETRSFLVNSGSCPTPIPPTPVPVVINCGDYTDQTSCENQSKCTWFVPPPSAFKPAICIDK
jgi:hypothetical protein